VQDQLESPCSRSCAGRVQVASYSAPPPTLLPPRTPPTPSPPTCVPRWVACATMVSVSSQQVATRRATRRMQRLALLTALFVAGPDRPTGSVSMDIPTSAALLCLLERSRSELGTLLSRRYLVASRDSAPKSAHWMTFVLAHLPSKHGKVFMRV